MNIKKVLFSSPFCVKEDEIDSTTERGKEVLSQPSATKWELWGYYLYFNGNNGYTIFSYMPNILQFLAYKAGFYPDTPNIRGCNIHDSDTNCYIAWPGTNGIPVSSMMLYVQAISFSLQFVLFTTFGSLADYGKWNTYILFISTVIGCATQIIPIAFLNDNEGTNWRVMMGIMIIALISYGTSLVFYGAAFPTLSDNLPIVRKARADPKLTNEEIIEVKSKWRNHVSAISTVFSNVGFLVMTSILSGISFIPWQNYNFYQEDEHVLGNVPLFNFISTAVCGVFWIINAIPYFLAVPSKRQGPPLPSNANHLTIGWKSIVAAILEARKLHYLFMYIIAYFMFADAVSTINQMISITQAQITGFNAQQITILNLASAVTSILGCLLFLWIQKQFKVKTKTNLMMIIFMTGLIPVWGCFGIGLGNFGIRKPWELWVFYVWSGLFTAPIWAWQNTMLAELVPKGKENLFFGLFGVVNKASSWIGPVVIGAITQYTDNLWKGWPFVLALFVISFGIVWFIDVDKAQVDIINYLAEENMATHESVSSVTNELFHSSEKAEI